MHFSFNLDCLTCPASPVEFLPRGMLSIFLCGVTYFSGVAPADDTACIRKTIQLELCALSFRWHIVPYSFSLGLEPCAMHPALHTMYPTPFNWRHLRCALSPI
jgi:hypothetical protein